MSAPHTNLEKQKRRHWAPLLGMALVVIFGVGMIFFWLTREADQAATPGESQPPEAGTVTGGNSGAAPADAPADPAQQAPAQAVPSTILEGNNGSAPADTQTAPTAPPATQP